MDGTIPNKKFYLSGWKGILAVVLGLIIIFWPEMTIETTGTAFGIFLLAGGLLMTATYIRHRRHQHSWLWLAEGMIDFAAGIYILAVPGISARFFLGVAGIWAILMGCILFLYFYNSRMIRALIRYLILSVSVLSFITGVLVLWNPFQNTNMLVIFFGIYAMLYGITSLFKVPGPPGV